MPFVGAERLVAVDSVASTFAAACAQREPRLISILAPQGWGKTRIVQQFYERLAAQQGNPAYWPPSLVPAPTSDLEPRKAIHPQQVHLTEGAKLPWMWWGIQCEPRQTGARAQVLAMDIRQLEQHAAPMLVGREFRRTAFADALEVGSEALSAFPVIGTGVGLLKAGEASLEATRHAVEHLRERDEIKDRRVVHADDPARAPLVERATEILQVLANAQLPTVVVVDDAHLADPSLIGLLQRIVVDGIQGPILCILTAWPDQIVVQQENQEPHSLGVWLRDAEGFQQHRCSRLELGPLATTDLAKVVRARVPRTPGDVIEAFARRADGNPLVAELMLRLPSVSAVTRDDRIELEAGDVATLPADFSSITEARWAGLPEDVRTALCLCTLQGREALEELLLHSYEVVRPEARDEAVSSVAEAIHPYAWLRRLATATQLLAFQEEANLNVARHQRDRTFLKGQIDSARAEIAQRIVAWRRDAGRWASLEPEVRRVLAAIHTELARDGIVVDGAAAAASAAELAELALDAGSYGEALGLAQDARRWHDGAGPNDIALYQLCEGRAHLRRGELEMARKALQGVVDLAESSSDVEPRLALDARANLAALLLESAEWASARDVLQRVVADATATLGADDDTTLDARAVLAEAVGMAGDFVGWHRMLVDLLADRERAFGADHGDAIAVRVQVASLGALADTASWSRDVEAALAQAERVLGADHPTTISARSALVEVFRSAGQLEAAREAAERTLADSERILGPDHPATLEARGDLAKSLVEIGDPHARELQEVALRELDRVVGPEHPATLSARADLAATVSSLGDVARARIMLERAVEDHERILGVQHVNTSLARMQLAAVLLETATSHLAKGEASAAKNVLDRAQALQEHALVELERGTLPGSELLLTFVEARAATLRLLDESEAAGALVHRAVADAEREGGPDHPGTLLARVLEARHVLDTGDPERARTLLERVLEDRERVLGRRHPSTIATRAELASMIAQIDGPATAHELRRQVLDDATEELGLEHAETIAALRAFAESAVALGDVRGACDAYLQLAQSAATVLGADHLDALDARRRHAEATARCGDDATSLLASLRQDFERLVARSETELGAQHMHTLRLRGELATILDLAGLADAARAAAPSVGGVLVASPPADWTHEEEITVAALDRNGTVAAGAKAASDDDAGLLAERTLEAIRDLPGYVQLEYGPAKVFGTDGFIHRFSWVPDEVGPVVQLQGYAVRDGRELTATATTREHAFEQLRAELDAAFVDLGVEIPNGWTRRLRNLFRRDGPGVRGVLRGRLPAGWMPTEQLVLLSPERDANIVAIIEAIDPGLDATAFAEIQDELLAKEFRLYKELAVQPAKVFGGRDGHVRFFAQSPTSGAPLIQCQAYYAEHGRAYHATGTCHLTEFARLAPVIAQALTGVRIAGDDPQAVDGLPEDLLATVQQRGEEYLMELPERAAQESYERVAAYLHEIYEDRAHADPENRRFDVVGGQSTFVRVSILPLGSEHTVVLVQSPVAFDVPASEELDRYLLTENQSLLFGAFSLGDDGTVILRHSILGDVLDREELQASVDIVLRDADEYDDIIVERFGGTTAFTDAPQEPEDLG
jgi:tetratricopeptide (TPR) repeat protein